MIRRALAALATLVLLAGCGFGTGGEEGTATLWVTRDRGAETLLDVKVDAGQTLMRALGSEVELETRYGGRYRPVDRRARRQPRRPARLVLVRERLRGRPERRRLQAP